MKKLLVAVLILAVVGGLIFAFIEGREEFARERQRESPVKAPLRIEMVKGDVVVKLDEAERQQGGVVVAQLERISHRAEERAFGTVLDVQELIDLRAALDSAGAQLKKVQAALDVARKEFERQKTLRDQNQNVSEKAFQTAEGAWRTEEANALAAESAGEAARGTLLQRWGDAVAKLVAERSPEFERLMRREDFLVQVTLPPGAGLATPVADAMLRLPDGKTQPAKLLGPAARTDPKIQGRSFLYLVAAHESGLLPGMNVVVLLPVGEPAPGWLVPESAVLWLHGKAWIYVQRESNRFTRRAISTEQPAEGGFFQPADFAKDEAFVVKGGQVLLSEEFRAQILIGDEAEGK